MSLSAVSVKKDNGLVWSAMVSNEIQSVERRLMELVFSKVPTVFKLSEHLLSAGGKRLRPALVALSAKVTGKPYDTERITTVGAAAELIHMATLVHDDVIDQTNVRRGCATANSFWGNKVSVLSGDHMLSKAFWLLSCDGDVRILETISSMSIAMSESEVQQAICEGNLERWKESYFDIVRGKTAGFFAACCKSGAIIGGASPAVQESLYDYGMQLGVAFQITDDILDIVGSPSMTGKPLGNDLREGKFTLPLLLMLDSVDGASRQSLFDIMGRPELSEEDILLISKTAQLSGAVGKASDIAASYASKATAALANLPAGDIKGCLESLACNIIGRCS